jgi:hypothetical protein
VTIRKHRGFRQVQTAVNITLYVRPVWSWCWYSVEYEFGVFLSTPLHIARLSYFIASPVGSRKRLIALSVNAVHDEGHRPASGARPPGRVLRRGLELSSPRILLKEPRDASGSLPGFVHRLGSLCVAQDRRHPFLCLSATM